MAMNKHIEVEHNTLLKKHLENGTIHPHRSPLDCELVIKWPHVLPSAISGFFYFTNQFKKNNDTNWVLGKSNIVHSDQKNLADEHYGVYLVV
jgi:hypothetical protein